MGTESFKPDAAEFAERLNLVLDGVENAPERDVPNAGPKRKGRGGYLAALYKVSKATGSDWVRGRNTPEPLRVLDMAKRWKVPFMWLYFGVGSRELTAAEPTGKTPPASQPAIPDPVILREAFLLAYQVVSIETGKPYRLEDDPERAVSAYAFLVSGEQGSRTASEVAEYMSAALRRRDEQTRGKESGKRTRRNDRAT